MTAKRASGILLHPTSLPSRYGIGDLGKEAYKFVDFLARSQQKLWQVLPLNPVGYGESPFQSYSAFAGNPLLISIDLLMENGLLTSQDVTEVPVFNQDQVEFQRVRDYKGSLLRKAFGNFKKRNQPNGYCKFLAEKDWLADYALFMALKEYFSHQPWNQWEKSIALREVKSMEFFRILLKEEIEYHYFLQYTFYSQWLSLKQYANSHGIGVIGDLPIFVSYDSSDAWANPHLFELDSLGKPAKVSGVPPDYFSATGQLWGNPHYRWSEMEKDDYQWWRDRIKNLLQIVDVIRIDHFRGFESYWEIPAGEKTAINGRWVKGPGEKFFAAIIKHLGKIPVIAEDLGIITPEVVELKERFNFPGMKILHFNLHCNEKEDFLPHHYEKNSVVYTGTHDNDTTLGWYKKLLPGDAEFIKEYLKLETPEEEDICWRLIEVAFKSKSNTAIIPLQDILCLDSGARMNYPGTVGGDNWAWRFRSHLLTSEIETRLRELTAASGRGAFA
ncbi:4-alpha-glucanotransferase [Desulforamulus reducens MI-1]|uniref:4-alpha-glucanotransferase n=1 Tax=Desulforamulus reducens (strain ATCC BAA-1160 / DSM 100696 / MI-1) TaxID=349161 RepID=A4J4I6_DESRM|nr:4-alpha-glucanotransferase [Desulforamulus reducens]ABO49989.1 4-alpha-glucanotransferase [Desulforamulus reducens MI-1]